MKEAIEMLKRHEGLRLKPYRCSENVLTIGYGHNLEQGITQEQADALFFFDVADAISDLDEFFPIFKKELDKKRYWVLVNMVFNLGISRFAKFKNMIQALKEKDYNKAADEMLDSLWAKQVGNRAIELSEIMREGE